MKKNKKRFGVIGCGKFGNIHSKVYKNNQYSELVAVCDLNNIRAKEFGKNFGVNYYTDFNKMFENEDLDAVAITTPDFAHTEPLIAAANKHINIFCEKPLVIKKDDLEKVTEIIEKNKIRIMVDYHVRWAAPFVVAKERISSGKIGKPIHSYMRLNNVIGVPTQGIEDSISWADKSSVLWFLGSHAVDCVSWIMANRVKKVYSIVKEGILKSKNINTEDMFLTTLEFNDGGTAQLENGWVSPNGSPTDVDLKLDVLCTEGLVSLDLTNSNFFQIFDKNRTENPDFYSCPNFHNQCYGLAYESVKDFVRKLYFDEEFSCKFEDSVNVNKVLFAIIDSSKRKEPVEVNY